jgi:hypothetical protein
MKATHSQRSISNLDVVHALARLLQRMEANPATIDAHQYRTVVEQLKKAFEQVEPGTGLQLILEDCPAASDVYENIRYEHAGLVRAPLEKALNAELEARRAIDHAAAPRH